MRNIQRLLALSFVIVLFQERICAQELYKMPKQDLRSRVSSFENINGLKGGGGKTNQGAKGNAYESIKAGAVKTLLNISGPGIIQRIWCTIDDKSPEMLRSLRLRMYWDNSPKPAVDVPFGDFFCAGQGGPVAFSSALFANPEGRSFICYITMPFKKGAKITLTNEAGKDLNLLFFDIDFSSMDQAPADMMYFHAAFTRKRLVVLKQDFDLLPPVVGTGRFLGVHVFVNVDPVYRRTWWGEGEVKMFIDGDSARPTIIGTGTEDYTGTGWGLGKFIQPYQGCLVADTLKRQYAFYRFHIPDPVYFHKNFHASIQEIGGGSAEEVKELADNGVNLFPISVSDGQKFTRLMETPFSMNHPDFPKGWVNFFRVDDYAATTYFYLDKPSDNLPALAPVGERIK